MRRLSERSEILVQSSSGYALGLTALLAGILDGEVSGYDGYLLG